MAIGEKLRGEREARNITIDQISAATGIGRAYLEDLERDAFKTLPGRAKFYIRAYAQTLGFDPQKMIDQYDREQEALRPGQSAPEEPERAAPRPVEAAIARWRKAALAAHGKPDVPATDDFEDDDLDEEPYDEADPGEERAPITLPSPGLMRAIAGTADEPQVERPVTLQPMHAELPGVVPAVALPAEMEPPIVPAPPVLPAQAARPSAPVAARIDREVIPAAAVRMAPPSLARVAASVMLGIVVVFAGIRLVFFKTNADGGEPAPVAAAPALPSPVPAPPRSEPEPEEMVPDVPKRIVAQPPVEKTTEMPAPVGALTVIESGIGRRIVNYRLAEPADSFAPGDVVWFSTRVTGGRPGQRIRHVWIHEGRAQQSIPLRLAGPDYHTHSRKTVYAAGTWTVEARDGQGEVLASASFECVRPD